MRSVEDGPLIICEDLSIGRGVHADRVIDGVSMTLDAGHAAAVMGPTGAGKSTLAALLAGDDATLRVLGGNAQVMGTSVTARGKRRRVRLYRTGYVAQTAGTDLNARQSVAELIGEPVTSRGGKVNARALAERVAGLLDELHLPLGAAAKYPYELSSGMRQRVAVARALILDPLLFVGDEPLAGLDVDVRGATIRALARRRTERGMALLLVTNDSNVVSELKASVTVLHRGAPIAVGGDLQNLRWTPDTENSFAPAVTSTL